MQKLPLENRTKISKILPARDAKNGHQINKDCKILQKGGYEIEILKIPKH